MAKSSVRAPSSGKLWRWIKILGIICAGLLVLVIIAYFVVTSSGFFKGVILPKVSKAIGAEVTVSGASIHPFKSVTLRDVQVKVKGKEPILKAKEIRVSYSLWAIIHGNILVKEVAVVSPTISVVTELDGSSNIPQLPEDKDKSNKEKEPSKSTEPTHVDIKKIAITGATILQTKQYDKGKSDRTEISGLNFSVTDIKNGQSGKLSIQFDCMVANNPPQPTNAGSLFGGGFGEFNFALSEDLKPTLLNGNFKFNTTKTSGALASLGSLAVLLQSDITATEVKQFGVRFQRGNVLLGEIRASGPFVLSKTEGRLALEVRSIDKNVLNLASPGLDFGTTMINSTNQIEVGNGGKTVAIDGNFGLNKLQVKRAGQTTPTLDLNAGYQVKVDLASKSALLQTFTLNGAQNNTPFLHSELSSPMNLSFGGTAPNASDSTLTVTLNNFNLADWRSLAGDMVSAGTLEATLKVLSQSNGKKLAIDLNAGIRDLSAVIASNRVSQAGVDFIAHVDATELKQFQIANYQLNLTKAQQAVASVSGKGTYDNASGAADIEATVQAGLPGLLAFAPQPDVSARSGSIKLDAHVVQKTGLQVTGNLALTDFTGKMGSNEFNSYAADIAFDVASDPHTMQLRKIAGSLRQGDSPGGTFTVSGIYQPEKPAGQFELKLDNLNENAVRPFLESMLAGKKLVSVNINGNVSAQYDPKAETAFKADAAVTKLVVTDPAVGTPGSPLEAKLTVDAAWKNQIANVKQFQVTLTPTARAKNELQFQGQVDMSVTNVIHGSLKLLADSLDLTSYYDLFNSTNAPATATTTGSSSPASTPSTGSSDPNKEPDAVNTPFRNFTVQASIGKLYLRELEVTNLQASLKLDGGRILLNPFSLTINGRPVNGNVDVNLGVPGYQYNISFTADRVPLAPLVDTFQPDRKGQIGGTAYASMQIKGEGIRGASLQKNLTAKFDVATTNMNLAVANLRHPVFVRIVNVVAVIPALCKNPTSALSILGNLGKAVLGGSDSGFAGKINSSPINVIELHGNADKGKVNIQNSLIESSAFKGQAIGDITLKPVLNDSTLNLPLILSIDRGTAADVGITSLDSTTNSPYVDIPPFVSLVGTLGDPKPKADTVAILKMGAKLAPGVVSGVGNLIGSFTGKGSTNSASAATNSTDQLINTGLKLLEGFGKKKK